MSLLPCSAGVPTGGRPRGRHRFKRPLDGENIVATARHIDGFFITDKMIRTAIGQHGRS